jgi:hypothetical protein
VRLEIEPDPKDMEEYSTGREHDPRIGRASRGSRAPHARQQLPGGVSQATGRRVLPVASL